MQIPASSITNIDYLFFSSNFTGQVGSNPHWGGDSLGNGRPTGAHGHPRQFVCVFSIHTINVIGESLLTEY